MFDAIEANRLDDALQRVDALIRDYPNFRLAHLVRGDLLLARSRPLLTFGNVVKTVPQEKIDGLRDEALVRLRAQRQRPADDRLPRLVLQLHPAQKHVLLVDSRRSRLYVFANDGGRPRWSPTIYVTLGKNGIDKTRQGDQKTPVGVYHVTGQPAAQEADRLLRRRRLPDQLPERVGQAPGPQRPRHLAARRAFRRLQPPAARERRLHRARQPRPANRSAATCRSA